MDFFSVVFRLLDHFRFLDHFDRFDSCNLFDYFHAFLLQIPYFFLKPALSKLFKLGLHYASFANRILYQTYYNPCYTFL